jgi:hypothetical protein
MNGRAIPRALAFVLMGVGCGLDPVVPVLDPAQAPAAIAEAICRAQHECPCQDPPWPDAMTCREQERQRLEDTAAVATETGLLYDAACGAAILAAYDEAGCEADPTVDACASQCRLWVGAGELGDPCEPLGITVDLDTCGPDLRCVQDACVARCEVPTPLGEGQRCRAGIEPLGECDEGLYCPVEGSECVPAPGDGAPCPDNVCAESAWCDRSQGTDFVCRARGAPGQACATDIGCLSRRCVGGECTELPAAACEWFSPAQSVAPGDDA